MNATTTNNANNSTNTTNIADIGAIIIAASISDTSITAAIDNGLINKEPAGRLIDKRLDKVKD